MLLSLELKLIKPGKNQRIDVHFPALLSYLIYL